jgi:CHAT domain-containing protein
MSKADETGHKSDRSLATLKDLRVGALSYLIDRGGVHAHFWFQGAGAWHKLDLPARWTGWVDDLKAELRATSTILMEEAPRLDEFMEEWGLTLLPSSLREYIDKVDVLMIVPHGVIHDLPLHLVKLEDGTRLGVAAGVAYCSSHTLFTDCSRRNIRRSPLGMTEFDRDQPWSGRALASEVRIAVSDTPRPSDELLDPIAGALSTAFSEGASVTMRRATFSAVSMMGRLGKSSPDVLCLVAHGFVDIRTPERSGLVLLDSGEISGFQMPLFGSSVSLEDQPYGVVPSEWKPARPPAVLSAGQLEFEFESRQDLVLLLACSAGYGVLTATDRPASLAESFLQAGATSVIAPSWDIDARATAMWATAFSQAWHQGGQPKAIAARHSLAVLLDHGYAPVKAGAFTVRGDWL